MTWDPKGVEGRLGATGRYDSSSALAQEYAGLKEDGSSRVDDEAGWREIKRDAPPKNAAEYEQLVNDYAKQGFDVKAIDMNGDDFTHSNIAIKPKEGGNAPAKPGKEPEMEMSPEYAHAKARVAQYREDELSGRTADELFGKAPDSSSFLDRYRMKLGERLENGNYRPPKLKDVDSIDLNAVAKNDADAFN